MKERGGIRNQTPKASRLYSRLPYSERNLAYKSLLSWTNLDRVYEANRKTSKALE